MQKRVDILVKSLEKEGKGGFDQNKIRKMYSKKASSGVYGQKSKGDEKPDQKENEDMDAGD